MPTNIKPEFQVERVTGKFTRPISYIIQDVKSVGHKGTEKNIVTNRLVHETEEFTDAYMIYFPQGHSMMVAADDTAQLMRLGVLQDPRLVDMESGEQVPEGFELSPKQIVERAERNRPRPMQGGLTQLELE